jgi:hypothetical protein
MMQPQEHDRAPLEYRAPKDDRADRPAAETLAWQGIAGALVTALLLAGLVFANILMAYALNAGGPSKGTLIWTLVISEGLLVVAALAWLSVRAYRDPRRRGWAFGIWIGAGLAILVEGICFGRLR